MSYFVYVLQADDGTYYTGQTKDLKRRLQQHRSGRVASTKSRSGWSLVHTEEFATRIAAIRRERRIKAQKSRVYIKLLVGASRDLTDERDAGKKKPG
jgi:putative endonuclease